MTKLSFKAAQTVLFQGTEPQHPRAARHGAAGKSSAELPGSLLSSQGDSGAVGITKNLSYDKFSSHTLNAIWILSENC